MSIRIIKPGMLATLQDAGRNGFRSLGVGSGGAMDLFAMKVANFLAGNDANAVVLEIHFPGPEMLFEENALIALTGADFGALLDNEALQLWTPVFVKRNAILKFSRPANGSRCYLTLHDGWQADKWLNSYSTNLKLSLGGFNGRALQKDDQVFFKSIPGKFQEGKKLDSPIKQNWLDEVYWPANEIRCIEGPEYDLLNEAGKAGFSRQDFIISLQSDRMGYRLESQPLLMSEISELVSSPVAAGTIQLLPGGNCIVLMADHQTTGGYPRIASVIKADLPRLAQAKPGQTINFKIVSLQEAEDELIGFENRLTDIETVCNRHFKNLFNV